MSRIFIIIVNIYQLTLARFLGGNCRFYPSCSNYAKQCFLEHGVFRALELSAKRLLRCHPLGSSGYDPVPDKFKVQPRCGLRKELNNE